MGKTVNAGKSKGRIAFLVILCMAGILINFIGVRAALHFSLPVFLDSIGTILAAVLGGLIPGIITGIVTNLINGIFDNATIYYGSISVLLALAAAGLAEQGCFRRFPRILLPVLVFTLIGGGLGSILTWFLYGAGIGEGISRPLALAFFESGRMNMFFSQISADLLIDLLDKTITTGIVALVCLLIPDSLRRRFRFDGDRAANGERVKIKGLSLRAKILIMISVTVLFIAAVVTSISLSLFRNALIEEEGKMAFGIAKTAASHLDAEKIDAYLEQGRAHPDYNPEIKSNLVIHGKSWR